MRHFPKSIKILLILIATTSVLTVVSCKKDEPKNSIVGKWTCTDRFYDAIHTHEFVSDTYEFSKNGTFKHKFQVIGSYGYNFRPYDGNYVLNGAILTLYHSRTDIYLVYIKEYSMIITDEDGRTYTYYKE